MKAKKIIFPTDFSTGADAALETAVSLARDTGATLIVVHVEEPPTHYGHGYCYYGPLDPSALQIRDMLEEVVLKVTSVACERRLITGKPAESIVKLAEDEEADMIVMGTHGRTGFARILMGSVTETVVRQAPCPVLTFKLPDQVPARTRST